MFGKVFNPVDGQLQQVFSKIQKGNGYYAADLAKLNITTINHLWEGLSSMPLPDEGFIPGMGDSEQIKVPAVGCRLDNWMVGA